MDSLEIRGIDDVGLPMPKGLPGEVAEPFLEQNPMHVALARQQQIQLVRIVDIKPNARQLKNHQRLTRFRHGGAVRKEAVVPKA